MKEIIKNNKGITLIALVVTIIVLIILAGISINLALGENGLITMAKKAKENIELAQIEEQEKLNKLYTQMENEGEFEGNITIGQLEQTIDELKEQLEKEKSEKAELEKEITKLNEQLIEESNKSIKVMESGSISTGTVGPAKLARLTINFENEYTEEDNASLIIYKWEIVSGDIAPYLAVSNFIKITGSSWPFLVWNGAGINSGNGKIYYKVVKGLE